MLRSKLILLFILSGALIVASCSDSGTGSEENGDGEETTEPSASVNNPSDGATLEGEITFSVNGESENGFDELRIFVGEEQVETVDGPSLPYEHTITTYEFNNGDYDLKAELDPADQDTTVEASVSTTFENYMVEVDTEGYIEYYIKNYNKYILFISDPDGNILRSVDLTDHSGGTVKLLPPSSLEDGAPEHFVATQFYTFEYNGQSNGGIYLDTFGALEPWTTRLAGESFYYEPSDSSPSRKEITVEMGNFSKPYRRSLIAGEEGWYRNGFPSEDTLQTTFQYIAETDHLMFTNIPYASNQDVTPVYKWEEDISNLSDPDTLRYDVGSDFETMGTTNVSHPSGLSLSRYSYRMSASQNTWDDGQFYFTGFRTPEFDANGSDTELGIFMPNEDHLFGTQIIMNDDNNQRVSYYQSLDDIPSEFQKVDGQLNISNRSFDNMQMEASGSMDYIELNLADFNSDGFGYWWVFIPNDTESFAFPNIADSLNSVQAYNRNDFEFYSAYLTDDSDLESYNDFLSSFFGSIEGENEAYRYKSYNLFQSSQSKVHRPTEEAYIDRKNRMNNSEIPIHLRKRKVIEN